MREGIAPSHYRGGGEEKENCRQLQQVNRRPLLNQRREMTDKFHNMTSSAKPEVRCHQRRTEPRPSLTSTENFV